MGEWPERRANCLPVWDYNRVGYYFVTVCTKNKAHILWAGKGSVGATCGRPLLSRAGLVVDAELARLSKAYPQMTVDKAVIMPNHVHLVLKIDACSDGRPQVAPTISRAMQQFKGAVTKRVGRAIWQKSFYDHIIRDEADYLRIWEYIDENPAEWAEDEYYGETEGTR